MTTEDILERLDHVRRSGDGWSARCPAHDDHNNSLASFYLTFGDIMSTDQLIARLRNNAKKSLAAAE